MQMSDKPKVIPTNGPLADCDGGMDEGTEGADEKAAEAQCAGHCNGHKCVCDPNTGGPNASIGPAGKRADSLRGAVRVATLLVAGVLLMVMVAACSASGSGQPLMTPQQVQQLDANITSSKAQVATEAASTQAKLDAAKAANDAAGIAAAQKQLDVLTTATAALNRASAMLAASKDPQTGSVTVDSGAMGAISTAATFIPPPYNVLVAAGLPLAWGIVQMFQKNNANQQVAAKQSEAATNLAAAQSLVAAVDALRAKAPAVADAMKQHKATILEQLTPEALAIVNEKSVT